jgi:hypothetical protein
MLGRLRTRLRREKREAPLTEVNYTKEHVALAKTIARRRRLVGLFWRHLSLIRCVSPCPYDLFLQIETIV